MRAETYAVMSGEVVIAYVSICESKVAIGTNLNNARARKDVFDSKDAPRLFDTVKTALEQLQEAINAED